jgi:hypothetical protein
VLAILPSIAFYRVTVQPEYKWGMLIIHGMGRGNGYGYLTIILIFTWVTFILEKWYKRKWYYLFPITLYLVVAVSLSWGFFSDTLMLFQGDVWGFQLSMGILVVITSWLLFVASIYWTILNVSHFTVANISKFSKAQQLHLLMVVAVSGISFFLFAQGRGGVHTMMDGIAVFCVVMKSLALGSLIERTSNKPKSI